MELRQMELTNAASLRSEATHFLAVGLSVRPEGRRDSPGRSTCGGPRFGMRRSRPEFRISQRERELQGRRETRPWSSTGRVFHACATGPTE